MALHEHLAADEVAVAWAAVAVAWPKRQTLSRLREDHGFDQSDAAREISKF
jgi:hypothetical protein